MRGKIPTSLESGRISVRARPSGRVRSSTMPRRTSLCSANVKASSYSSRTAAYSSASRPSCSAIASWKAQRISFTTSLRSGYGRRIFSPSLPSTHWLATAWISSFGKTSSYSCGAGATLAASSCCSVIAGCIAWCAQAIASTITSSGTSLAPASTMVMPRSIPATTRSRSDCSRSSGVRKALSSPFTLPTRRPATGPSNGVPVNIRALLAATIATISGRKLGSILSTVATTCTSWR